MKTKFKKVISLVLVFMLVIGIVPFIQKDEAQATYDITSLYKMTLSYTSTTYSGSAKKPTVTVKDIKGNTISSSYYKVTYSNNTSIGKATVKVTGTKSPYKGQTLSKTFTIVPAKVVLSSASGGYKKITVKWKALSGGVSYQIAYKKSSASSWSTVNVSSSTYSKTISSLSSGKYYVKVRAYKKVSGKTYYGSYCSQKTVTVKQ